MRLHRGYKLIFLYFSLHVDSFAHGTGLSVCVSMDRSVLLLILKRQPALVETNACACVSRTRRVSAPPKALQAMASPSSCALARPVVTQSKAPPR